MSMELLKEIDEKFDECYERNLKPSFEWMVGVSERLKKVLTHPDIKPVAWALFSKKIMPSGVAYAVRRVEIELSQIEADLDIQDAEIIPLFMKRDLLASNQSALIEQFRQEIEMKELDNRALLEDVLGTLKYILNRNEINTNIVKKNINDIEVALVDSYPSTVNALADERNTSRFTDNPVAILHVKEDSTSASYCLDELSVLPIGSHNLYAALPIYGEFCHSGSAKGDDVDLAMKADINHA